jgi:hypothetical protein
MPEWVKTMMREVGMKVETRSALPTLLRAFTDAELHELLVTVQTELLNRPAQGTGLAVEVVTEEEAEVLALYRRLPPAQRDGLQMLISRADLAPALDRSMNV